MALAYFLAHLVHDRKIQRSRLVMIERIGSNHDGTCNWAAPAKKTWPLQELKRYGPISVKQRACLDVYRSVDVAGVGAGTNLQVIVVRADLFVWPTDGYRVKEIVLRPLLKLRDIGRNGLGSGWIAPVT